MQDNTQDQILTDVSQITRKNVMVIGIAIMAFALLLALSLYKWFFSNIRQPIEVFFHLMFISVLLERAQAQYIVEMDQTVLRFRKKSLLGRAKHEVPYHNILGIYRYHPQLLGVIKFRRTYRMNSSLDNRIVWVLAYETMGDKGKKENRRIFFKASEPILAALAEKLPTRVKISEQQVVMEALQRDPNWGKE
ncbi:hypothetical protein [Acetonema longum]|uniref:Uncharacterized protein n=1 Tax=Acetonema longum DSM 6540 TaxID=1009370 RepID=F7NML8_9FIRM|nr:hypothetical protein [Acetonema longum]EGO62710.1 hypothetical protein ALO_16746 [Acetonema longum DSM 6540]